MLSLIFIVLDGLSWSGSYGSWI